LEDTSQRKKILTELAKVVFVYHTDPGEFRAALAELGYPMAAQQIENRPRVFNTQMGNFGEILASEYVQQILGFEIPVFRLRYNPNRDSSMKGDDILAFKFGDASGSGREILVGESKTYSIYRGVAVEEAYMQLYEVGRRPYPISLTFVAKILDTEGKGDKARSVRSFLNRFAGPKPKRRFVLFLITGNQPRDPFRYIQNRKRNLRNLTAINVHILRLQALVKQIFVTPVDPNDL
jgi:Cap4 SAVED domain